MKAIIIDDEKNARLAIAGMLVEKYPDIQIVGQAANLPDGIQLIQSTEPDVVFLDISMPGQSGLEILNFFDENTLNFAIVFFTAHDEFALQAFELSAVDYLLKPLRIDALDRALKKVRAGKIENLRTLKHNLNNPEQRRIALQTGDGTQFIELKDIIYLKADGSYTHFILNTGKNLVLSRGLSDFSKIEETGLFIRIHRSHIINLNHISKILKQDGGFVVMANGDELSIAPQRKKDLMEKMNLDLY
jgi:two-component system LytT family response regulator